MNMVEMGDVVGGKGPESEELANEPENEEPVNDEPTNPLSLQYSKTLPLRILLR